MSAMRAPTRCKHPGCGELIVVGQRYCVTHLQRHAHDRRFARDVNAEVKASHRFYYSAAWKRAREEQLEAFPFCAECNRPANVVDHVVPRRVDPSRELDATNLQSMCQQCHNRKRQRESRAA